MVNKQDGQISQTSRISSFAKCSAMRRASPRLLFLLTLIVSVLLILFHFFIRNNSCQINIVNPENEAKILQKSSPTPDSPSSLSPIECHINAKLSKSLGLDENVARNIDCYLSRAENEVYLPFYAFLKSYVDVKGELSSDHRSFEWSHSFGKIYPEFSITKDQSNDAFAPLLQFSSFDVEARSRVLCTSAKDSVPVSTQWDKQGYYYVTQIAQFGLAHHAKMELKRVDGSQDLHQNDRIAANESLHLCSVQEEEFRSEKKQVYLDLAKLSASNKDKGIIIFHLSGADASTKVLLNIRTASNTTFTLGYIPEKDVFLRKESKNMAFFGFGEASNKIFVRDIYLDFLKAFEANRKKKHNIQRLLMEELIISGNGCLRNVSITGEAHELNFRAAAEYFVKHQDEQGGWPVDVMFNKDFWKYSNAAEIKEGWYSAMGQGQAISLLVRAFHHFGDLGYLEAATKATSVLEIESHNGGVKALFLDEWVWYEEYPTQPNSFVLNGFIYTLIGLHDLKIALKLYLDEDATGHDKAISAATLDEVNRLWSQGIASLLRLLPLFDAGSSSFYDLRHVTMRTAPKIARWDYHATHINLLLWLSKFLESDADKKFVLETAQRWIGYMAAISSGHN